MFYLLNKEKGITSFKAIDIFAKNNNIKKIGHTGTLDPMATGLLLVATNDDTKLINFVDKGFKTYIAKMKLGYTSDTYDSTGEIKKVNEIILDEQKVINKIKSYEKIYSQLPPIFSAKKINGKKSYELARKGIKPLLKSSKVNIKKIINIKKINNKEYEFEVTVSRGTYIRSLIHDIGKDLKIGAIMTSLVRNKIGTLTLKDCNKEIELQKILSIDIIKFEDIYELLSGKEIEIFYKDGQFAVEFKKEIIGIIEIINNKVVKRKLLGNKCKRIIDENC